MFRIFRILLARYVVHYGAPRLILAMLGASISSVLFPSLVPGFDSRLGIPLCCALILAIRGKLCTLLAGQTEREG